MQRLFDLPATAPALNPLSPCDRCGKAWATMPCPDDWEYDCCQPVVILLIPTIRGTAICARCNYAMIIPPDSEYGRLVPWHKSLWGYLYEQGVI